MKKMSDRLGGIAEKSDEDGWYCLSEETSFSVCATVAPRPRKFEIFWAKASGAGRPLADKVGAKCQMLVGVRAVGEIFDLTSQRRPRLSTTVTGGWYVSIQISLRCRFTL
jgi:hypothetical protein